MLKFNWSHLIYCILLFKLLQNDISPLCSNQSRYFEGNAHIKTRRKGENRELDLSSTNHWRYELVVNIIHWWKGIVTLIFIPFIPFTTEPAERCGFQGSSTFMMKKLTSDSNPSKTLPLQLFSSHITMTYAALVTLLTLGDDLERVDRDGILKGVAALQNHDGR